MSANNYIYDNESSIPTPLKCTICLKPFVDPVITPNGDRNCRSCITNRYQLHNSFDGNDDSSSLLGALEPVQERLLLEMLDCLPVQCPSCQQSKIPRRALNTHLQKDCPKREVSCLAADLRCPWKGAFDQLNTHMEQCIFEPFRPVLQAALGYQTHLNEYQTMIEQQASRMQQMETSMDKMVNRLDTLQKAFSTIFELARKQTVQHESLQTEIDQMKQSSDQQTTRTGEEFQRIHKRLGELNQFCRDVQDEYQRIGEFAQTIELQKNEIDPLPVITAQQLDQEEMQLLRIHDEKIKDLAEQQAHQQQRSMQITEMVKRHEDQIGLLAHKKSNVPVENVSEDFHVKNYLTGNRPPFVLRIQKRQLTDADVYHIFHERLTRYPCAKIVLENNMLTNASVNSIAEALQNNQTITELCLARNVIGDGGVHALAQTLAMKNSTLEWLDLNSNNITDDGVEYLADMLKLNKSLAVLNLNSNQLSNRSIRFLAGVLSSQNQKIEQLSLASNGEIDDDCIDDISALLEQNRTLKYFFLNDCSFSNEGKDRLQELARKRTGLHFEF